MTAQQGLRLETLRAEAKYMEVQQKLDELARHYRAQEHHARAEYERNASIIHAQLDAQRAELAANLPPPARESLERTLHRTQTLELEMLRRAYHDQAEERRKQFEEEKRKLDKELFAAVNAAMKSKPVFEPTVLPPPPRFPGHPHAYPPDWHAAPQRVEPYPPAPVAAPPRPVEPPAHLPRPAVLESNGYPPAVRSPHPEYPPERYQDPMMRRSPVVPIAPHPQPRESANGLTTPRMASPEKSPMPQQVLPHILPSNAPREPVPGPSPAETRLRTPLPSARVSPEREGSAQKRRADDQDAQARILDANRAKRTRLEDGSRAPSPTGSPTPLAPAVPAESAVVPTSTPVKPPSERTITFDEVFGTPEKPAQYKHIIVQFPPSTGDWYILRCDEHGVHFGEHPLRGAAKHLASAQHGFMSKAHALAIEVLGHKVVDCTKEKAEMNNQAVLMAFKAGYKIFNANNLSQAKRAELGFPPLDLNAQKQLIMQHKAATASNLIEPMVCRFYVAHDRDIRFPVLILPWGDLSPAGLVGTLAETGLFKETTEDGESLKLPRCYVYHEMNGEIVGIKGWAKGYERGGHNERKREFPVLCIDSHDRESWTVGWVRASYLSPLDFNDPEARNVPYFEEARDHFYRRVLRQVGDGHHLSNGTAAPRQEPSRNGAEDVEMTDARNPPESDVESTVAKDGPASASMVALATQALTLQTPTTSFTAINADRTPRSAAVSPEPPSRTGSVSSAGPNSRRVYKIHARSSRNPDGAASPTVSPVQPTAEGETTPNEQENLAQSPKSAGSRRPLPDGRGRTGSPPAVAAELKSSAAEDVQRSEKASSDPASRQPTPPATASTAPATEPATEPATTPAPDAQQPVQKDQPPQIDTPSVDTPKEKEHNAEADAPAPAPPAATNVKLSGSGRPDVPSLTLTLAEDPAETFDIAGIMSGDKELYRAETSRGPPAKLIDDHESGVLSLCPLEEPFGMKLDPKQIKAVERVAAQNGVACVVTIKFTDEREPLTLVLDRAQTLSKEFLNGVQHARRLCKRLLTWNPEIELGDVSQATDSIKWRFSDEAMTPSSAVSSSSTLSTALSVQSVSTAASEAEAAPAPAPAKDQAVNGEPAPAKDSSSTEERVEDTVIAAAGGASTTSSKDQHTEEVIAVAGEA